VPGCAETCPRTGQGSHGRSTGHVGPQAIQVRSPIAPRRPKCDYRLVTPLGVAGLGQVLGGALFDELFPDPREPFQRCAR